MIKLAFRMYGFIAILSPWLFLAMRIAGIYNFKGHNSLIFFGLFAFSGLVMFLTFKNWE